MKAQAKSFWDRNSSPKAQKQIAKVAKIVGADAKAMHAVYNATYDLDDFMPWTGSCPLPAQFHKKEWRYPACWWTGEDCVNESAVDFWFGHLL